MKRYLYILFVMASPFICGCEVEEMKSPGYEDLGKLEVSFVYGDAALNKIRLTPVSQTIEVQVRLNFENIKWNVISDQPWCMVEKDVAYEGDGTFTITVDANKELDDKEAVVSLCAGDYKADLHVCQNANMFIMSQIFGLGMKRAGCAEVNVKTLNGVKWNTRQPEWMHVEIEEISTAEGEAEYKMMVQWDENTSASRLGVVELYKDGYEAPSSQYAVWQFGDGKDYDFEADGNIRLSSKPNEAVPLEIRTPSGHIDSLKHPDWMRLEKVENDDNTTSWLLYFSSNPSDCFSYRETQLIYTVMGTGEERLLPVIYQNYHSAGGLISAKGFAMFAQSFNAGGDISEWLHDGGITIKNPVDMSKLEGEWISIGTDDRPFDLTFNGGGNTISGFSASSPLLGVCDGAEISNVVLDSTCKVAVMGDFNTDLYVASLAIKIENTTISNCTSAADVELSAAFSQAASKVYAGGLVAYAGSESVISQSGNYGDLNITVNRAASDGETYIGGVAAYLEGEISGCTNTGKISDNSMSKSHYVGGLVGELNAVLELDCSETPVNCSMDIKGFDGGGYMMAGGMIGVARKGLKLKSPKWNGSIDFHMPETNKLQVRKENVCIGGVAGAVEAAETVVSGAETSGSIKVFACRDVYWKIPTAIGGIVGCASNGCTVSESVNNASLEWDATSKSSSAEGVVSSGGIVGRIDKGVAVISGCTNNGPVHNILFHDAKWNSGSLLASRTGGVIGTYGYVRKNEQYAMDFTALEPVTSNNITITDCHTTSEVLAFRGLVGGIAGYLYNASVSNCSYTGVSSNKRNNCNVGGIAGAVENTNISDCTVKASLYGVAQGACEFKAGGIAAYLYAGSSISNCRYFGQITTGDNKTSAVYYGGIAGEAQAGCSITGCGYGGSIPNSADYKESVKITEDNYADYIVGNKAITATDCSYWDGE